MTQRRLVEGNVWQATFGQPHTSGNYCVLVVGNSIQDAILEAGEYLERIPGTQLLKLEQLLWVRGVIV